MKSTQWLAAGCLLLALGACGSLRDSSSARGSNTPPPPTLKPAPMPAPAPVLRVTPEPTSSAVYADYIQRLGPADQEKEIERQRLAFARDRSDLRRLHYAMALTLSASTPATRRGAAPILEPLLKDAPGRDADIRALAGLLMGLIQEQRRGDELERKLDAMKEIERTLMQRERASPAAIGSSPGGSSGGKP